MNTKIILAIMAGCLVLSVKANASWYDISFSASASSLNNVPSGSVSASGMIDVSGGYATAGWIDVSGPGAGINAGHYSTLFTASYAPNPFGTTTSTLFYYDNVVSTSSEPFFTQNGLAWQNSDDSAEVNLYYNGGYELDGATDSWSTGNAFTATGSAKLTAVPEPSTIISGALMLLPFGAGTLRILRRNRAAWFDLD